MGRQLKEMARQIDLTIARERAMLSIEMGHDDPIVEAQHPRRFHHDWAPTSTIEEITLTITHYGPTNAFGVTATGYIIVTDSRNKPEETPYGLNVPDVIESGDEPVKIGVLIFPPVGQSERDQIGDEKLFLHLYGSVGYRDIFDNSYVVPFWYTWKVEWIEAGSQEGATIDQSGWENRLSGSNND